MGLVIPAFIIPGTLGVLAVPGMFPCCGMFDIFGALPVFGTVGTGAAPILTGRFTPAALLGCPALIGWIYLSSKCFPPKERSRGVFPLGI
jgi:hypothetical protein